RRGRVALESHLIVFLVKDDGEVLQNSAAERSEFVGEVGDRPDEREITNRQRGRETAHALGAIAGERADGGARSRRDGEDRLQTHGVEAQRRIAAGIDQRGERLVPETYGNDRGLAVVVERDGRAADAGRSGARLEHYLAVGIIEGQQGLAEQWEAENAVNLHPEMGREGRTVVDENLDVLET